MKKSERIGAIIKILSDSPNKLINLDYFCTRLGAAKSSISEDLRVAKEVIASLNLGVIETVSGAGGGVKYSYQIDEDTLGSIQKVLLEQLNDPSRLLGGGFLYTSDIMFNPEYIRKMAMVFASVFRESGADCVVTIETKGIPLAFMTAQFLNLPAMVIRRESRISEGPTVSINYFSGSSERIQKMSISKKAAKNFNNALVIDDFMRAGGSLKGVSEILLEFDIKVVGAGVAISTIEPEKKKIDKFVAIIDYDDVNSDENQLIMVPNQIILSEYIVK